MKLNDPKKAKAYFQQKTAFTTGPFEVDHMIKQGDNLQLIDVRQAEDYTKGHIPSALNLPADTWGTATGLAKENSARTRNLSGHDRTRGRAYQSFRSAALSHR